MKRDREEDEERRLISERAAEWFLRLEEWLSLGERRKYWRWLKKSQDHVAAALDVGNLASRLRKMKLRPMDEDADIPPNVVDLYPDERPPLTTRIRQVPTSWRIAAVLAMVAVAASLTVVVHSTKHDRVVETDVGEWQTQTLADGSTVKVGPLTRISVQFGDTQRSVHVHTGDAFFDVAKDASRPFVIATKVGAARAVGTQFAVSHHDGTMTVSVLEGVVEVVRASGSSSAAVDAHEEARVMLSAGEQVDVSKTRLYSVRQVDIESAFAWIQGKFIFSNLTIAQAAREFNRRNRLRIDIEGEAVADRQVRGIFNVADPRGFAGFLAGTGLIRVVEVRENVLRLEPVRAPDVVGAPPMQAEAQ